MRCQAYSEERVCKRVLFIIHTAKIVYFRRFAAIVRVTLCPLKLVATRTSAPARLSDSALAAREFSSRPTFF